MHSKFIWHKMC